MKNTRYIAISMLFVFLLIPLVQAEITAEIDVKASFGVGDKLLFNYTLTPDTDVQATIVPYVECPSAPAPPIMGETINLTKDTPYEGSYEWGTVMEFFEPQTCTASIVFTSPIQDTVSESFDIDTDPSFEFNILLCKDSSCSEETHVFIQNENIYLDYESEVDDPSITLVLTYPDSTAQQITLPTSISAEQIGVYVLELTASKDGYKTVSNIEQFAVIEKEANISSASECNANGVCEAALGETSQTCPQDCPEGTIAADWTLLLVGVIIALIVVTVYLRKSRPPKRQVQFRRRKK